MTLPGEVCPKHDHLLRWHHDAGSSSDVAVLHWHWFLPTTSGEADAPQLGSAPVLPCMPISPTGRPRRTTTSPQVAPDRESSRLVVKARSLLAASPFDLPAIAVRPSGFVFRAAPPPLAFSATFAPRAEPHISSAPLGLLSSAPAPSRRRSEANRFRRPRAFSVIPCSSSDLPRRSIARRRPARFAAS